MTLTLTEDQKSEIRHERDMAVLRKAKADALRAEPAPTESNDDATDFINRFAMQVVVCACRVVR